MQTILLAINVLLILGFIGIDVAHLAGVIKEFPTILFWENVLYAFAFGTLTAMMALGYNVFPWMTLLAAFVAGRVSRSVLSPYGFERLAMQHVPLLALLLIDAILSALSC